MHKRLIAFLAGCLLVLEIAPSEAQQSAANNVSREQSKLLLDFPGLEEAQERYDYLGWDARYSVERHYAALASKSGSYPRAQFNLRQLAPMFLWTTNTIDESYVKAWPFFKDGQIQILQSASPVTSNYVQILTFKADNVECVALSVRRAASRNDSQTELGTLAFDGFYCPAPGRP